MFWLFNEPQNCFINWLVIHYWDQWTKMSILYNKQITKDANIVWLGLSKRVFVCLSQSKQIWFFEKSKIYLWSNVARMPSIGIFFVLLCRQSRMLNAIFIIFIIVTMKSAKEKKQKKKHTIFKTSSSFTQKGKALYFLLFCVDHIITWQLRIIFLMYWFICISSSILYMTTQQYYSFAEFRTFSHRRNLAENFPAE